MAKWPNDQLAKWRYKKMATFQVQLEKKKMLKGGLLSADRESSTEDYTELP
jgi:hypothetical protein